MMGNNPYCQWAYSPVRSLESVGIIPHMTDNEKTPLPNGDWRSRLQAEIAKSDHSMKSLSLAAGLGETFVRDALKRGREPGLDKMRRIAEALGTTVQALTSQASEARPTSATMRMVPIVGKVQAGEWRADEFSIHIDDTLLAEAETVPAFDEPHARAKDQLAFRVLGDSMDEICPRNGIALVIPYDRAGFALRPGLIVVAERELHGQFELTIKEVGNKNGHWVLHPRSSNPTHETITFPSQNDEETVRIIGFVVRFLSPSLI